jgi:predicted N-formylglutamate amidohydrolase
LVIDLNRPPGHPESISEISDQIPIPGNRNLSEPEQNRRLTDLFEPYHGAITEALAHLWRRGMPPALFSVHSFTPIFGDEDRPWDVGVLWNRDPRIAKPLMDKLKAKGLNVGDNLPYSGRDLAYTINMHGGASGLANCVVEINQDQVRDQAGLERWAGIFTDVMGDILVMKDIHEVREY